MRRSIHIFAVITSMALVISGCSININGRGIEGLNIGTRTEIREEEDIIKDDVDGIEQLSVINGVGEIDIIETDSKDISIKVVKKVKGKNSSDKQKVLDNIKVFVEQKDKTLSVTVKAKDGSSLDFWDWVSHEFKLIDASVDFEIEVPERINSFEIKNGVGDVEIIDADASVDIELGVGGIYIENAVLTGKSDINLGTGDIDISIDKFDNADSLNVEKGVGGVTLQVPEDAKFDLDAQTAVGTISGNMLSSSSKGIGGHVVKEFNGGGTDVRITTGTGDIEIDKR